MGEKHAADPNDGGKRMQRDGNGHMDEPPGKLALILAEFDWRPDGETPRRHQSC
jgi:hypothetical protein